MAGWARETRRGAFLQQKDTEDATALRGGPCREDMVGAAARHSPFKTRGGLQQIETHAATFVTGHCEAFRASAEKKANPSPSVPSSQTKQGADSARTMDAEGFGGLFIMQAGSLP